MKRTTLFFLLAACMWIGGATSPPAEAQEPPEGFRSLFNGRDLEGWDGNPQFWRVEEGAIVGQTTRDNPTRGNTFLIWRRGEVGDFVLRLKYKIEGGNSGIQYRSREASQWVIGGYQADIDASQTYTGILYEERGRGILAQRGQQVVIDEQGEIQEVGRTGSEEDILSAIRRDDWNDYEVIAQGNHLVHKINGKVTVEVTDNQANRRADKGLLALQLHAGPPMKIQFRDIYLKPVSAEGDDASDDKEDSAENASAASGERKKVVFVAGRPSHGYGSHEHNAGCLLLAKHLQSAMPNYECQVFLNGWPAEGMQAFEGADAVVVYCDGGGGHLLNPHLDEFQALMDKGVGLVCIHYAVEVPKGKPGDKFLEWIGGYFETNWSVNPHWTAQFESMPDHPIARGVEPFEINDEWYFHMRFREGMEGVTPILSAVPPENTMSRPDGTHSGNPHVRAAVAQRQPQHVAWAAERPGGGRGFGFTGGHFHWNWGDDNFRKVMLNAIVWAAHGEVPAEGIGTPTPSQEELEANQDEPKPEGRGGEGSRRGRGGRRSRSGSAQPSAARPTPDSQTRPVAAASDDPHDPANAVANLDVHPELKAVLFASEPMLLSPSNIDVDHRGRVWVCEIVNYRGHNGKRPEGDRILILEDTDGDGQADHQKVYYQGEDVISPHGICVLGNRVIISTGSKVICMIDEDGDDRPDRKEDWFTNIRGDQHDHGIHAFIFGPDGKLYFNFGNAGVQLCDAEGNVVVDQAGNPVRTHRQPYQQGMVFRCNLDRTGLETLGWNFRNNWMVTVDSFGSLWQSDNDDDGNRGVRINYVMEFGNYGYVDELTGAGWQSPRTNLEEDIPNRHWHQNDPGVVPNLLLTGAGSPTGITVYEGDLLPSVFHGQLLHCDAGPSVTRAYVVAPDGAGYEARIENILEGTRDRWFRPSDVKIAPDGSLFVADWYDPGVGGHQMGDLDRGRIFRVVPKDHDGSYRVPTIDVSSAAGAVAALRSPNYATRYLAWTALDAMGSDAESALLELWQDPDPRMRARALWLLGKIPGRAQHYVELAIQQEDPNLRITGLRLARQVDSVDALQIARRLAEDPSPAVRRECAVAIRFDDRPEAAELWANLAAQHSGDDRWYLEALGIGAELKWDACLEAWLRRVGSDWQRHRAGRDIVWRSRAAKSAELLTKLIINPETPAEELARYLRALDFQPEEPRRAAVVALALHAAGESSPRADLISREALTRLTRADRQLIASRGGDLERLVDRLRGSDLFVEVVNRLDLREHYDEVLQLTFQADNRQLAVKAARTLLERDQADRLRKALEELSADQRVQLIQSLGASLDNRAADLLRPLVQQSDLDVALRREALRALSNLRSGAEWLIEQSRSEQLDPTLVEAAAASLQQIPWQDLRRRVARIFPSPPSKDQQPLPSLNRLARMRGNAEHGREIFRETGTCAKCHVVRGEGQQVGPDLSQIGSKLSREGLFESILYPSAGISHNYETYVAELSDGNVLTGVVTSQTDREITITSSEGLSRTIPRDQIELLEKQPVSLMPADLLKLLSQQDLVDLVEYLTTLRE